MPNSVAQLSRHLTRRVRRESHGNLHSNFLHSQDVRKTNFLLLLVILVTLAFSPVTLASEPSRNVTILLNGLRKTCYQCHGEEGNIEGEFDLTAVLGKDELSIDDSATWLRVLKEVNTKRMPPEPTDLSDAARNFTDRTLKAELNQRNLAGRMLTSQEIDYDHSLLYGYRGQKIYAPFETLKLQKLSDSRYRTVDSSKLMSSDFLSEYQRSLETLIRDYTQLRHEVQSKWNVVGNPSDVTVRNLGDIGSGIALDDLESGSGHFELRCWGWQKLYFRSSHPGRGMSPGTYRIEFQARALDRHRIAEKKAELEVSAAGGKERFKKDLRNLISEWQPLLYSRARLSLHAEKDFSHRKQKVLETLNEFDIRDNDWDTYSFDFTLKTGGYIYVNFINGPSESTRWKSIRFASRIVTKDPEHPYPRIQVRDMKVTLVKKAGTRSEYDIAYLSDDEFDSTIAQRKVKQYASELGLRNPALGKTILDQLPETFDLRDRYAEALKLLSMSDAYLFLDSRDGEEEATRHVSYAFLKRKPSDEFRSRFRDFRAGRIDERAMAKWIVDAPEFRWFLREFVKGWFMGDVDLDLEKYSIRKRELDVSHEPIEYLNHIFRQDQPIRNIFHSEYSVADAVVAPFYEIEGARYGDASVQRSRTGGILQQVAFLKSQSDGIDGLPFRRAKWVLENVFNERLGNPPNDVNNDDFVAALKLKTFRERTDFHSKQRGCYECHNAIDPIAFAYHHRDTLGELIAEPEKDQIGEFLKRLKNSERAQVRAFTTQLIQFITGRETTIYDQGVIDDFVGKETRGAYRAQKLLAHILHSYFSPRKR